MTLAQNILDYLWSVSPNGAANSEIAHSLGIKSHQSVYMATQDLLQRQMICGEQDGKTWVFHAVEGQMAGHDACGFGA